MVGLAVVLRSLVKMLYDKSSGNIRGTGYSIGTFIYIHLITRILYLAVTVAQYVLG